MKTIENDPIGDRLALPVEVIHPLFAVALAFKEPGSFFENAMRWRLGRITFGRAESKSLFYNAAVYVRVMLPFWIGVQVRWAGKAPTRKEFWQGGIGWKLNGRLAALFRIQSDRASAAGVSGPNVGQAEGFEYGTK